MQKKDLREQWGKNGGIVAPINEYLSRVDKINEERIYCNKFLQQYSALYFRRIDRIRTEITISEEDRTSDKIHFDFTDERKKDDFFKDEYIKNTLEKYIGGQP